MAMGKASFLRLPGLHWAASCQGPSAEEVRSMTRLLTVQNSGAAWRWAGGDCSPWESLASAAEGRQPGHPLPTGPGSPQALVRGAACAGRSPTLRTRRAVYSPIPSWTRDDFRANLSGTYMPSILPCSAALRRRRTWRWGAGQGRPGGGNELDSQNPHLPPRLRLPAAWPLLGPGRRGRPERWGAQATGQR